MPDSDVLLIFQFFDVKPGPSNSYSGISMKVQVKRPPFAIKREYAPDAERQLTALQKLLTAPIRPEANHE